MAAKAPTIIDVAKAAGVSKSTAARVLAGLPNISDTARERVRAAAVAIGYERNTLAAGMRSGRSGLLGLVIPDISNPFWAEVARGAQDRAAAADLSLMVMSSDWDPATEARHIQALRRARVDGAVINPVSDQVGDLPGAGTPVVLIGSAAEAFAGIPSVGSDIHHAVTLGMDFLVSKGHDMPSLILGPPSRLARTRFLNVVRRHCIARDRDPGDLAIESADYTVRGGRAAMHRLLARRTVGHGCVFAANDMMALGALMALHEAGVNCPRDVSVLGFDGSPIGACSAPQLTTIAKPAREIAARAVSMLIDRIDRGTACAIEELRVHLPGRLVERASVADLSAAVRRRA
jgi:LacI family transcriptional regulator